MRTIKFRGKDIHDGKWIYGYFKKTASGDCYIEDELGLATAVNPETVGQLVCVAACGDEIYEGDYIRCRTIEEDLELYLVEWEEDIGYMATGVSVDYSFGPEGISDCEPTGNIWDESWLSGIGAFCEYGDYCIYGGQDEYPAVQDFLKAVMKDDDCKEILEEYDIDEILLEHVETAWYVCGFTLPAPVKGSVKVWRIRNY